jgi:hypothetical protein
MQVFFHNTKGWPGSTTFAVVHHQRDPECTVFGQSATRRQAQLMFSRLEDANYGLDRLLPKADNSRHSASRKFPDL